MVSLPARYATLCVFTSNLSQFKCFPTKANSMCRIRMVRATVVGEGCRNPAKTKQICDSFPTNTQNVWIFLHNTHYLPFNRCPTKAKLKLELKLRPTKWSICLQCQSKGWRISINTSSGLWEIDRTNPFWFHKFIYIFKVQIFFFLIVSIINQQNVVWNFYKVTSDTVELPYLQCIFHPWFIYSVTAVQKFGIGKI